MNATTATTRTAGQIGRYDVAIATEAQKLSPYQIGKGIVPARGVWLSLNGRCVWSGTTSRVAADPSCASAFLSAAECAELAAMVAACSRA